MAYKFNFTAGSHTVEAMAAATVRIQEMLQDQNPRVQQYLNEWDSDTKLQYEEARAQWEATARQMPATLGAARQGLAQIQDIYQGQEVRGTATWSR
jgi:uncharacterized protein YukE